MKKYLILFLLFGFLLATKGIGQNLEGVKIYINPGHGGFNSDDRNVPIPPFALGDTAGFWESKSNLAKGLHLRSLLDAAGAEVIMSRTQNRTEDDRPLSAIAEEANANQVDFMISIHSNAFNSVTNYVLQLFHGWDNEPILPQSMDMANLFWENLISNKTSYWTNSSRLVRGDKSFAPEDWNGYGVLRPLTVPGLISEGSFHDYLPETYRLMNREYKYLEAWHFYKAFLDYFEGGTDSKGKIAGYVKDNFRKVTNYYATANSKDQWLTVNGAKIKLQPGDLEYKVDSLNNGFFLFDNLEPGTYQLKIEAEKYVSQIFDSVVVNSNSVTYQLVYLQQDRSDSMMVIDYAPKVGPGERVSAAIPVIFHFNFEVNRESFENAFSISPEVNGTFSYDNQERTAIFTPDLPMDTSTVYTVTLNKNVEHIGGLPMQKDFTFSFLTEQKNRLSVLNIYPRHGMKNVYENTQIRIHFDGRLVEENLNNLIWLEDAQGNILNRTGIYVNEFSGKVGSYAFTPSGLSVGNKYFLKLGAELKDTDGLKLWENQEIEFEVKSVDNPEASVVFDFEQSALTWSVDNINSMNISEGAGNRILRYSTNKLFEDYSYRLLYDFNAPEAQIVVRPPAPLFSVSNNQHIGLYVYGNLSDNQLYLLFGKNGIEHEVLLTDIDFSGWQLKTCDLNFPEKNEQYEFSGIKLVSGQSPFSAKGMILFDNMMVSDSLFTRSEKIARQGNYLKIYPNPATNLIQIEMEDADGEYPYKIVDMNGKVVQSGILNFPGGKSQVTFTFSSSGVFILSLEQNEKRVQRLIVRK